MTAKAITPMGTKEIAGRLGVKQQTVAAWKYRGLMPEPSWTVNGGPCWPWREIEKWAKETGRYPVPRPTPKGTVKAKERGNLEQSTPDRAKYRHPAWRAKYGS